MIKKLFTLFKLGRKLAKSDALKIATKFNEPPLLVKVLFSILSFSFSKNKKVGSSLNLGERLSSSLHDMGKQLIK